MSVSWLYSLWKCSHGNANLAQGNVGFWRTGSASRIAYTSQCFLDGLGYLFAKGASASSITFVSIGFRDCIPPCPKIHVSPRDAKVCNIAKGHHRMLTGGVEPTCTQQRTICTRSCNDIWEPAKSKHRRPSPEVQAQKFRELGLLDPVSGFLRRRSWTYKIQ